MALAALFLCSACWITLSPFLGQITAQPASASPSSAETPAQAGSTSPSATTTPTASKSAPSKKRTGKKKPSSQDCGASPTPSPSGAPASQPANQASSDASAAAGAAKPTPPNSCPPPKIIVRQGGTTEPRIQLAGGPTAAEAARKRDEVNHFLGATDQNLKKTAGWQLSSSQRDTITQTQQFMEQSKAAMKDGDLERARTLAWKAELLSEDLVNPQK